MARTVARAIPSSKLAASQQTVALASQAEMSLNDMMTWLNTQLGDRSLPPPRRNRRENMLCWLT